RRSFPKAAIHGLFPTLVSTTSLSFTASVTNSRKGIPRSAATDLALRKMASGISRVVFIHVMLPYLWERVKATSLGANLEGGLSGAGSAKRTARGQHITVAADGLDLHECSHTPEFSPQVADVNVYRPAERPEPSSHGNIGQEIARENAARIQHQSFQ